MAPDKNEPANQRCERGCRLYLEEKQCILEYQDTYKLLNQRREIISNCQH